MRRSSVIAVLVVALLGAGDVAYRLMPSEHAVRRSFSRSSSRYLNSIDACVLIDIRGQVRGRASTGLGPLTKWSNIGIADSTVTVMIRKPAGVVAGGKATCSADAGAVRVDGLTVWQAWDRDKFAGPGKDADEGDEPTPDDVVATKFDVTSSDYRQGNSGADIPIAGQRHGSRLCIPGRVGVRLVRGGSGTGSGMDLITPCLSP